MGVKNTFKFSKIFFLILVFALGKFTTALAQCGTDGAIEICTKENYNQGVGNTDGVVDLFLLLGGSPAAGGTWTDVNSSGGLNTSTGLLNIWQISRSGIFTFSYQVAGCATNSIVTITLGGFPGFDNDKAVACSDDDRVPLFSFLGSNPNPDSNGSWSGGPVGAISGSNFNAITSGVGTYTLIYTSRQIGNCPIRTSTVILDVVAPPVVGSSTPLILCETDNFDPFTNFNLFSQLSGNDSGGDWSDTNAISTGEISGSNDSFINIKNIATNFGPGTYSFLYTVRPGNPICPEATISVSITIKSIVDLTGATLTATPEELCFSAVNTSTRVGVQIDSSLLTTPIPDGTYSITYTQTGSNPKAATTVDIPFSAGRGNFFLDASTLVNTGVTTINVTGIAETGAVAPNVNCSRIINNLNTTFTINENPDLSDTVINVVDFCLGEEGVVTLRDGSGIAQLDNGTYSFNFTIRQGSNAPRSGAATGVVITNGSGTFNISDLSLISTVASDYVLTINQVTSDKGCVTNNLNINSNLFEVRPIPDATSITVSIPSICSGDTNGVIVNITNARNLADGNYDIAYDLAGANGEGITRAGLIATNVSFVAGVATFNLPNGILAAGSTTLTITSIRNTVSTCEDTTFTNPNAAFTIRPLPDQSEIVASTTDVCEGSALLVNLVDSNRGIAPELSDGNYTVTYSISGVNSVAPKTTSLQVTSGQTSLTIPTNEIPLPGPGVVTVDFETNDTTGCAVIGNSRSVNFNVLPVPQINNATLTAVSPICRTENVTLQITGTSLPNGLYDINYNFSGASNISNLTATDVSFTNGDSSPFTVPTFVAGDYTITLTNITSKSVNNSCSSVVSNVSTTFTVVPLPLLTVAPTVPSNICLNTDVQVTLSETTTNLPDGTYKVQYTLTGANTQVTPPVEITFDVLGGNATFNIPFNLLQNTGVTTLTIISITSVLGNCITSPLTLSASFNVDPLVIVDNTGTTIAPIATVCLGSNVPVSFTASTLNAGGTYNLNYTVVSGSVNASGNATVTLDASKTGNFSVDTSNLNVFEAGTYTLTITGIADPSITCPGATTSITQTFILDPLPTIVNADLAITNTCLNQNGTFNINNLPNGSYDVEYTLTGQAAPIIASIVVPGSNTISIDKALLAVAGDYTIIVTKLTSTSTPTRCSNDILGVSGTITVNDIPNVSNLSIQNTSACLNADATVTLNNVSNLVTGDIITFDLDASLNNNATFTLTGNGIGTFQVNSVLFGGISGIKNITIKTVSSGSGCSVPLTSSVQGTLNVNPIESNLGLNASVSTPICTDAPATVTLQGGNLTAGQNYTLTYILSGFNSKADGTATITWNGNNLPTTFSIPANELPNAGATRITLILVTNSSTGCDLNGSPIIADFVVVQKPIVLASEITIDDVCLSASTGALVQITSTGLNAGDQYQFSYSLTGANATTSNQLSQAVTVGQDGSASFIIPSILISNQGSTVFNLLSISNVDPNKCGANNISGVSKPFTVLGVPTVTSNQVNVAPICLGQNIVIAVTGSSLLEGDYTVAYSINGGASQNTTISIDASGNGNSLPISSNGILAGQSTLTITSLSSSVNGCATGNVNLVENFTVNALTIVNAPNTSVTTAPSPVCLGQKVTVTITAPDLAIGQYDVNYDLKLNGISVLTSSVTNLPMNASNQIVFDLDSELSNAGNYSITITGVGTFGVLCSSFSNTNVISNFVVTPIPTINAAQLNVADVCIGQDAFVSFTNLPDGTYDINYAIAGQSLTATGVVISSNNKGFNIDKSLLAPNSNTVIIGIVTNTTTSCQSNGTPVSKTFNVNALPVTTGMELLITNTCFTEPANGTISKAFSLSNGSYTINYNLLDVTTNTTINNLTTVVTLTNGEGPISISDANFITAGNKVLTITSITNSNGCGTVGLSIGSSFNVEDAVNTDNATIVVNEVPNICLGNGANAVLSGLTLPNGQYTMAYDISGAKNTLGLIAIIDLVSGVDNSIPIDATAINLPGNYSITVTGISNTSNCTGTTKVISDSFVVNAIPTIANADIQLGAICKGQNAIATVSNLPNGTYSIAYTLSVQNGAQTLQGNANLTIPGTNTFTINTALLNAGSYNLAINSISNGICSNTTLVTSVPLVINDLPDLNAFTIDFGEICLPTTNPVLVPFTTNLANGSYTFTFNFFDGTSTTNGLSSLIIVSNGAGTINVDRNLLTTQGSKSITITDIENSNRCKISSLTISDSFDVNPPLDVSNVLVSITQPICLGGAAQVNVDATSANIPAGTYTVSYQLAFGAGSINRSGIVILNAANGFNSSFDILATDLALAGDYTATITGAVGNNNCTVSSINTVLPFKVGNVPQLQLSDLTLGNVCIGSDASIAINSSSLDNGNYTINYILNYPNGSSSAQQTGTFTMNNGVSSPNLIIDKSLLNVIGNTTITISQIVLDGIASCTNATLNIVGTLNVVVLPNVTGFTIDFLDTCVVAGSSTTTQVSYTTNLADGNYTFNLSLDGSPISGFDTTVTSGTGVITFNGTFSPSTKSIQFQNILNENRCASANVSFSDTFIVKDALDVSNVAISVVSPICLGSDASVTVNAAGTPLTLGQYTVGYTINIGTTSVVRSATLDLNAQLTGNFSIVSTDINTAGDYSLTGISITLRNAQNSCNPAPYSKPVTFTVSPIPTLVAADLTINPVCIGNNVIVSINSTTLPNGLYTFTYQLTYPDATKSAVQTVTNRDISNGVGNFVINSTLLPFTGLTTITLTGASLSSVCGNNTLNVQKDIRVDEVPNTSTLALTMSNGCFGTDITGKLDNMPSGTFKVFFDLTNPVQLNQSVDVAADGTFVISSALLPNVGLNTIKIVGITNTVTNCSSTVLSILKDFNVIELPNLAGGTITSSLTKMCGKTDLPLTLNGAAFLTDGKYTIKYNISAPNQSSDNLINIDVKGGKADFKILYTLLLNSGTSTITFVEVTSDITKCGAPASTIFAPISIIVDDPAPPVLNTDGNIFCIKNKPTIANLSANVTGTGTITWYSALEGGDKYRPTDLLENGNKYYATLTSADGCEGTNRLLVQADLTACGKVFIPDGFSPNYDGLNDEFYVKDIETKYPDFKIEIFNRYGNIVFKGDISNPRFNGKSNQTTTFGNGVLPVGIYFYILYLNDAENTPPIQGRLFLNR